MADDIPEERELFYLTLLPPEGGASLGAVSRKTIMIERNDAPYGLLEIFTAGSRYITTNLSIRKAENRAVVYFSFNVVKITGYFSSEM